MEKMIKMGMRSVCRSAIFRSRQLSATNQILRRNYQTLSDLTPLSSSTDTFASSDFRSPLSRSLGIRRFFSEDVAHLPAITDPDLLKAFRALMAAGWDDLPSSLVKEVKSALSKNTDDKTGKEIVENVFRSAEAIEEFGAMVMNLKMELDDAVGASGENTKPLTDVWENAIRTMFSRYTAYLESFGPDESFLRKKVETELGGKMIFLKMRCKGLGADWTKVSVIATSGLAGSYVEQRS